MNVKSVSLQEEYGHGGTLDCIAVDFPLTTRPCNGLGLP